MAATFSTWAMTSNGNSVHPFFQKATNPSVGGSTQTDAPCGNQAATNLEHGEGPTHGLTVDRSGTGDVADGGIEQPGHRKDRIARKTRISPRGKPQTTMDNFATPIVANPDLHPAKRQRTTSPIPESGNTWFDQIKEAASKATVADASSPATAAVENVPHSHLELQQDTGYMVSPQHVTVDPALETGSAKKLVLNGKGGLGTPPNRKPKQENPQKGVAVSDTPPKRGRPKKKLLVVVQYKSTVVEGRSIGTKIDDILTGVWRYQPAIPERPLAGAPTFKAAVNPSKPVHSFFSAKPISKQDEQRREQAPVSITPVPSTIRFGTTPRKSRPVQNLHTREDSDFERDQRVRLFKQPRPGGMLDAPWPGPGWNRVEPTKQAQLRQRHTLQGTYTCRPRRQKGKTIHIRPEESIITRMQTAHLLKYTPRVQERNLPLRSVETGASILGKVVNMVSEKFARHTAITSLIQNMSSAMSAFDLGTGDTQCWSLKYAPQRASNVLQTGKEPAILRDWLQGLTINSIEKASLQNDSQRRPPTKAAKVRARRKADDMDDFLVDSDEDMEDDLRVLSDDEEMPDMAQRTIVRNGGLSAEGSRTSQRLTNAVLLSGPHGCGKSAAAYAVARELGFEVFEISPASRRSGKDIFDKVGDMALNHQVRRGASSVVTRHDAAAINDDEDVREASPPPDMTKQKSLNSFFTATAPKSTSKPKPKSKPTVAKELVDVAKKPTHTQSAFSLVKEAVKQKQSLILFEEVDILFDDDKLFWESLLDLAVQSKRPIIMTCNDESLVPLNALSLHGILRFRQPPVDLAVDYLLLVAATEGHLLKRRVIEDIYEDKRRNLRASISQLDFLCQMGIGDQRGGLGWYLPRWPPGVDVDATGAKLRVVSTDTVDDATSGRIPASDERLKPRMEDLVGRNIDSADLALAAQDSWLLESPVFKTASSGLLHYSRNLDLLSSVDIYAPTQNRTTSVLNDKLDATQPPMTDKTKHSFITGYGLLQADLDEDERQIAGSMAWEAHSSMIDSFKELTIPVSAYDYTSLIGLHEERNHNALSRKSIGRVDFSAAFDSISNSEASSDGLTASCFDGTFRTITEDLAPYARSIVSYDLALEQRRSRLDALLGGRSNKRQRTTRAARSAFEGGPRATTRKERWFTKHLDYDTVMKTGGPDWPQVSVQSLNVAEQDFDASSRASTDQLPASQ